MKTMGAASLGSVFAGCKGKTEKEPNTVEPGAPRETQKPKFPQVPKRKLGKLTQLDKSGKVVAVEVPCLSVGGSFNFVENQIMLTKSFQWGVSCWDTADSYAGGNSELGIGKFLLENPEVREKLFIVTKASGAITIADVEEHLQASLKRMNTKYIDLYYIMDRIPGRGYSNHGLSDPAYLTDELRQWVKNAKKRKLIRFFGFSTHKNMAKCLVAAARLGWIDVIMPVYNFRLMQDKKLNAAIEACHKAGIGLIAMKTQAAGQRVETEEDKKLVGHFLQRGFTKEQAKIKVVLEDKRISSACVRMQNIAHLTSNVAAVLDKTELTQADRDVFKEYAKATCRDYCAGCAYICDSALPDMPYVSDVMRYLMYYNSYGEQENARQLFAQIPCKVRNKLFNIDYRLAEACCPQHLPIGKLVAEAVRRLA